MDFLKKKKIVIFNIFVLSFLFIVCYKYMSYDVLIRHDRYYPFSPIQDILWHGRFFSKYMLRFFFGVLPSISPNVNINDMANTVIAFFKSFTIIMSVILYTKIFFISSNENKLFNSNKKLFIVMPFIFLFVFNDCNLQLFSFMESFDNTTFFDYNMNLPIFLFCVYILLLIFVKREKLSISKLLIYSIIFFICSITNEIYLANMFLILIFLILLDSITLLINKIKNINSLINNSPDIKYSILYGCLFLFIFVIGIVSYYLFSNYSTGYNVGGGHTVNWKEQFSLIIPNFPPFLYMFKINIIDRYILYYILLIFSLIYVLIYERKYLSEIKFALILFISGIIFNLSLIVGGATNTDGNFYIAHPPIIYTYFYILLAVIVLIFGIIFSNYSNKKQNNKKRRFFYYSFVLLLMCTIIFNSLNYSEKYTSYINKMKKIRNYIIKTDSIALDTFSLTGMIFIPISDYKIEELYSSKFNNFNENSESAIKKIVQKEFIDGISRIFVFDTYENEYNEYGDFYYEWDYDNFYITYLKNVYHIIPKTLVFTKKDLIVSDFINNYKNNKIKKFSDINERKYELEELNQLIENNPDSYISYMAKANYYSRIQEFDKAIEYYTKAISFCNNNYFPYYFRGILYRNLGKNDKAIKDLKIIAEKYPNSFLLIDNLGKLMKKNKNYDEAIRLYSNLIKIFPYGNMHMYKDFYFKRAEIKELNGDLNGAKSDYLKSAEINSCGYIFHLYFKLADVEYKLGNFSGSLGYIKQELSEHPNNDEAKNLLLKIEREKRD